MDVPLLYWCPPPNCVDSTLTPGAAIATRSDPSDDQSESVITPQLDQVAKASDPVSHISMRSTSVNRQLVAETVMAAS